MSVSSLSNNETKGLKKSVKLSKLSKIANLSLVVWKISTTGPRGDEPILSNWWFLSCKERIDVVGVWSGRAHR